MDKGWTKTVLLFILLAVALGSIQQVDAMSTGTELYFTISFVDSVRPEITLNGPYNNTVLTAPSVVFNATISDNHDQMLNCSLIIDGLINDTEMIPNNGTYIRSVELSEGIHNWSIICDDRSGNIESSETATFKVNLTTPMLPYCGDGSCNDGETCSSCAADCGVCPPSPPSGGGSGGSGGVSGYYFPQTPQEECMGTDCTEEIGENIYTTEINLTTEDKKPPDTGPNMNIQDCFNGMEDPGEEGIDCGGVCEPCSREDARIEHSYEAKMLAAKENFLTGSAVSIMPKWMTPVETRPKLLIIDVILALGVAFGLVWLKHKTKRHHKK